MQLLDIFTMATSIIGVWVILWLKRFYSDTVWERKLQLYCLAMSIPHVDKIDNVSDDMWKYDFLSSEVLCETDISVMNEGAIELRTQKLERWWTNCSSINAIASEELQVLATDVCSNVSRASANAIVSSSGLSTDGNTATCSNQVDCMALSDFM